VSGSPDTFREDLSTLFVIFVSSTVAHAFRLFYIMRSDLRTVFVEGFSTVPSASFHFL